MWDTIMLAKQFPYRNSVEFDRTVRLIGSWTTDQKLNSFNFNTSNKFGLWPSYDLGLYHFTWKRLAISNTCASNVTCAKSFNTIFYTHFLYQLFSKNLQIYIANDNIHDDDKQWHYLNSTCCHFVVAVYWFFAKKNNR